MQGRALFSSSLLWGYHAMQDELSQIAHLFLSGGDSSGAKITVRALVAEHLPDPAASSKRIAAHFARQLGSAALLQFENGGALLRLFSTSQIGPKRRSDGSSAADANDLSRAVSDLPERTSLLLVVLDLTSELLAQCPQISVVTCPESKIVVDAYSQLKRLAPSSGQALGLTMVDCLSVVQGQGLAERLCQAAKEFLGLILRLDAVVLRSSRLRESKLARATSIDQYTLAQSIDSLRRA